MLTEDITVMMGLNLTKSSAVTKKFFVIEVSKPSFFTSAILT